LEIKVVTDLIIPALNEAASIALVLRDLPNVRSVIVVDNGCTDQTPEIARSEGALVVKQTQRGYGAACLRGLQFIESQINRGIPAPDVVAFLDADYSDHPDQLTDLIGPIKNEGYDFVLGSRILGEREPGAMPPQSYFGNKLACFLMRLFFGSRYTDLGPFRAIRYPALRHLKMADENFGWTIEMQIKATRAKLKIKEVPVRYRKRIGKSKISGTISGSVKAGVKILYTVAKYGVESWRLPKITPYLVERSNPVL
jgi:glycosyltransferase involved in cell wall biosynthesis